jgi:lipopolysaccharide/colanic/teichoic acid biosynthesis glycosyltransferase
MPPVLRPGADHEHKVLKLVDISLSCVAMLFLLPFLVLIAILIRVTAGGSPLYGHRRYGKDGRTFLCYKFRTMAPDADARLARLLASDAAARAEWHRDHKLRLDPRVTAIGRILRKTSLDELPQLINILRGEMSIVGPRPIVATEVKRYGRRFADYCSVRPGITGIWQISGRNDTSYRRRVAMDTLMVRSMSPRVYARVLAGTVRSVLTGKGAY